MAKKTILLVEDDPDDEMLTRMALEENHLMNEIVVAHDGVEALDYLFGGGKYAGRELTDLPQVVLLDLKLPKLNGLDVLRAIRADDRTRLLPVVILTSANEDTDLLAGYNLGVNSYVLKPVDFHQFTEAVKQLGLYWLLLNVPLPGDNR
ncbi:MAG: response regulator [Candidatus Manganitrophus sp. SB1]|nr:response regulator [Candidatus Manganitrophus morganii]